MSTDAVVIWGELLWDRYPVAEGGDCLGGAPANVAWHLAQAGGWAQLVTRVGDDDAGRRALAELDGLVDTSLIQIDPERATGEVTIAIEDREPRYTLHPGRAWERIACTDEVRAAIDEAGVFVYGTLAQRTSDGLAQWQAAVTAARTRAVTVYDANLRPNDQASHAIGSALEHADVIKLNDREVAQIGALFGWRDPIGRLRTQLDGEPQASLRGVRGGTPLDGDPLASLRGAPGFAPSAGEPRGKPRVLVVTHGAAGSTIYPVGGEAIAIAGVAARPGGDNVGCGDAYLAVFVYGMTAGWDLATSGRIASRWAAEVASVRGATPLFEEAQIAALLET